MTPLTCFIYFVSLYSSLTPYSAEERRPFPPVGMPGKPTSGTLCPSLFYSRLKSSNQSQCQHGTRPAEGGMGPWYMV